MPISKMMKQAMSSVSDLAISRGVKLEQTNIPAKAKHHLR